MNRTSPKFLKAIPPLLILRTAMACPAFSEDIQALIKNAEGGNPKAQFNLCVAYGKGEGVPQDYAESMKWYRKAAEQGLAEAQYNLGVAYYNGQGVSKDYVESMKWFRMAAEQGHAAAQCILGIYYSDGHVVPQDYMLAYFWASLAATRNTGEANNRCANSSYIDYAANAARHLTPEQLTKAQQMIREWEVKHPRK